MRSSRESRALWARLAGSVVSLAVRELTAACASRSSMCRWRMDIRASLSWRER